MVDTVRTAKILRRLMLPLGLGLVLFVVWAFGTLRVPQGMDTMTVTAPPGSTCIIRKRPGSVVPTSVVFFEYRGGMLLSRVERVDATGFWVAHENLNSTYPDGAELGHIGFDAIVGQVLTAFAPETSPSNQRGR